MKYFLIIAGLILFLAGIFSLLPYIRDYSILSSYGKGYIWGNTFLMLIGLFLLVLGIRKTKAPRQN